MTENKKDEDEWLCTTGILIQIFKEYNNHKVVAEYKEQDE